MPIEQFLPKSHFSERHSRMVGGSAKEAFQAFMELDYSESFLLRLLFSLRGIDSRKELEEIFFWLQQNPPHAAVLGLIARPWRLRGDVKKIDPGEFISFNEPEYAKIAWSFTFKNVKGGCLVETETRIKCTDRKSRRKFGWYWFFIRPFSGLVRVLILSLIEKNVRKIKKIR